MANPVFEWNEIGVTQINNLYLYGKLAGKWGRSRLSHSLEWTMDIDF